MPRAERNMLSSSGMDCNSYSQTLEGWASGGNTPADLTLGVSGLSYDSAYAQAAHSVLADTRSWNITGDLLGHCSVAPVTLPVRLVSFTGTLQHSIATLQWQTGSEAGSHHFDIEASKGNGSADNFSSVGYTDAKGSGHHYIYSVPQPERTAYYRLKITDGDGSYTYSDNIVMLTQNTDNNLSVYPNPATDHINIAVRQAGHIRIYSILGKLLKTAVLHAGLNVVNISSFSTGVSMAFNAILVAPL